MKAFILALFMKSNSKFLNGLCLLSISILFNISCKKEIDHHGSPEEVALSAKSVHGHLKQTKTYTSEVLTTWINFDLRLLRTNPTLLNNFIMMQQWGYSSIALYEAVVAGMPAYQTLSGQLYQMPVMPATSPGLAYHWPTCANAVLAAMKRNFYQSIPAADKMATDSLEAALNARYMEEVRPETFQRSVDFGKAVAHAVYDWAKTDGSLTTHPTYVIPTGPGLWEKTFPLFANPQNPYWANNRPLMAGSVAASYLPAPPVYSTDPSSVFFQSVKAVYDVSQVLTDDQKAQAIFWRDVPGGGHAHWLSIFLQVLNLEGNNVMLDKAALVYAKMGITQSDARITCWKSKYTYNVLRPITYIRSVMAMPTWNSYISTPNHPEYPSAHSTFSSAASGVLTREFGDGYSFTDHTYDFLGLPARAFNSFNDVTKEAGQSRIYAGLHYAFSISAGNVQGGAISNYLNERIKFLK